jgi:hypothetical protein
MAIAAPASAAPEMCTDHDANPQGVVATHLLAKIDGSWVEPANLCVGVKIEQRLGAGARTQRAMYFGVWHKVDGAFPETQLPPGTPISVGLRRPPGMIIESTFARWRNGIVLSDATDTVMQGKTVRWDYHGEAYFGGPGLDCSLAPADWPSTFTAYARLNPLNADGTPNFDTAQWAGSFYESNTVGALFPKLNFDADGNPTGLQMLVSGCGDGDPATHEGFFDGFTPASIFHGFGITDQLLEDAALVQGIVEVHDLTTDTTVDASFSIVRPGELALEPIDGVAMPAPPTGSPIIGLRTASTFSYSEHDLLQRGTPAAMSALQACRAKGGAPQASSGQLVCVPDTVRPGAKLITRGRLKRGRPVVLSCDEPCGVKATLARGGKRLARGTAKSNVAGKLTVRMKLTAAGRKRLKARRAVRATLTLVVTDRAGNATRIRRGVRLTR